MLNFEIPNYLVTEAVLTRAEAHEQALSAHRAGAASQKIYKAEQNKIGFIGELLFGSWLYENKFYDFDWSEPDLRTKGDEWDYLVNGYTIDVKTIEQSRSYRTPIEKQLVRIEQHQIDKPMDFYVFTLYRSDEDRLYILGASTKVLFKDSPTYRFVAKGESIYPGSSFKAQGDHHAIEVQDLLSMHQFGQILREKTK